MIAAADAAVDVSRAVTCVMVMGEQSESRRSLLSIYVHDQLVSTVEKEALNVVVNLSSLTRYLTIIHTVTTRRDSSSHPSKIDNTRQLLISHRFPFI